jgi:hypothetical protein
MLKFANNQLKKRMYMNKFILILNNLPLKDCFVKLLHIFESKS